MKLIGGMRCVAMAAFAVVAAHTARVSAADVQGVRNEIIELRQSKA